MLIFHIETPDVYLYADLLNRDIFEIQLSKYATPYQNQSNSFDVSIKEENLKDLIKIIEQYRAKNTVRIYQKENDYYRPFIIEQSKFKNIYHTFFYQILKTSEKFTDDKDLDFNFLELFEVEEINPNHYQGFYSSYTLIPRSARITNRDTGTFKVEIENDKENSMVRTVMENVRIYQDFFYLSPYNSLLKIPNKNGSATVQITEYMIRYKDMYYIHFADEFDFIEIYTNEEEPIIINKLENPKNDFEKEIITFVNNYQNKNGAKRIRINQENE